MIHSLYIQCMGQWKMPNTCLHRNTSLNTHRSSRLSLSGCVNPQILDKRSAIFLWAYRSAAVFTGLLLIDRKTPNLGKILDASTTTL